MFRPARKNSIPFIVCAALGMMFSIFMPIQPVRADDKEGLEFFEKKIRPVLVAKCYECHSAKSKPLRAGLRVDTRDAIRDGGDSGESVVPDDVDSSLLITALEYVEDDLQMPPDGKLDDQVIADFKEWIEMGAPDPRDEPKSSTQMKLSPADLQAQKDAHAASETAKLWAFQPVQDSEVPDGSKIADSNWPVTDLDRFVAAMAADKQSGKQAGSKQGTARQTLSFAADADRRTLLRRTTFALTGLPPTPDQLQTFLADDSQTAFSVLVERLLASPQFGERWGRHWLDVARFSESTGGGRSKVMPEAWRYRDYVIASFNNDKPFDQFVREQIAGDLLPHDNDQQLADQLTATGFLALGPSNYELQDKELLTMEVVDEQIDTIGRAFLGMTIGCARCHDHKFDPIPTKDYYALAGIFRSTKTLVHSNVSNYVTRELPVSPADKKMHEQHAVQIAALQQQVGKLKRQMQVMTTPDLPGTVVDSDGAEVTINGNWKASTSTLGYYGDNYLHDEGRPKNQSIVYTANVAAGEYQVFASYTSGTNRSSEVPVTVNSMVGQTVVTVDQRKRPPMFGTWQPLGTFSFSDSQSCVVKIETKGTTDVVIADAIWIVTAKQLESVLGQSKTARGAKPAFGDKKTGVALAKLSKQLKVVESKLATLKAGGPQKSIVMSVREEQKIADGHVHIRGQIRSLGEKVPRGFLTAASWTKPSVIPPTTSGRLELANWIADPANPLTARVVVNRVCRHLGLTVVDTPDNFGSMGDAPGSNELLDWLTLRFIEDGWSIKKLVRRITASHYFRLAGSQSTGDARLGFPRRRLDAECLRDAMLAVTGELDLQVGGPNIAPRTKSEYGYKFTSPRRSVYLPVFRNATPPLLAAFDFPNANLVSGKRNVSTLPTQALFLMNSPFVIERSRKAAERLMQQTAGADVTAKQRVDLAFEWTLGRPPTADERTLAQSFVGESADVDSMSGLFQSLFSSLDFRYVD